MLFHSSSLNLILPEGVSMLEMFSGKEVLVNHFLLLFQQTAFTSACLCQCCLPLPASAASATQAARLVSTQQERHEGQRSISPGHKGPWESTAHNSSNPLSCWFSIFLPPSPQTHGGWQMRQTIMFAIETRDLILLCLWKCTSATVAACCAGREIKCHFQVGNTENKCNQPSAYNAAMILDYLNDSFRLLAELKPPNCWFCAYFCA